MRHSRVHLYLLAVLLAVAAAPGCGSEEPAASGKKRLLLIGQGPDGHPAGTHEFLPGRADPGSLPEAVPGPGGGRGCGRRALE